MCGRITQGLTLPMLFDRYRLSRATPALNIAPHYTGCPTHDEGDLLKLTLQPT